MPARSAYRAFVPIASMPYQVNKTGADRVRDVTFWDQDISPSSWICDDVCYVLLRQRSDRLPFLDSGFGYFDVSTGAWSLLDIDE